jgi:hypothetical protein
MNLLLLPGERRGAEFAEPAGAAAGAAEGDAGAAAGPGGQDEGAGQPGGTVRASVTNFLVARSCFPEQCSFWISSIMQVNNRTAAMMDFPGRMVHTCVLVVTHALQATGAARSNEAVTFEIV